MTRTCPEPPSKLGSSTPQHPRARRRFSLGSNASSGGLNGSRRKGRRPNGVAGPFNINIKRRDRACAISATSWFAGGEEADETAIVVAGKDKNGHGYVLAEISGRYPPTEWARLAITAYRAHRADRI